jgi:hypothetical protein
MAWISVVLLLDADGSLALQRALGACTWVLLAATLWREAPLVRVQTAVVVAFATLVEYTFAPGFEVYTYRFDNVPAYVPPGHGLVYLAALGLGRSTFVRDHLRACVGSCACARGAWALWGLVGAAQTDVLGAFWYLCLVGFCVWGPSQPLYVGAFVMVSYLELLGTSLGTWTWATARPHRSGSHRKSAQRRGRRVRLVRPDGAAAGALVAALATGRSARGTQPRAVETHHRKRSP